MTTQPINFVSINHGPVLTLPVYVIPALTDITIGHIRLEDTYLNIQGFGANLTITQPSFLRDGATLHLDGHSHNNGPLGMINNTRFTVDDSTLFGGQISGDGTIVATNNASLLLQGSATSETIILDSSHLDIGGAQNSMFPQTFGNEFLAPIKDFGTPDDTISIDYTTATYGVLSKISPTLHDLSFYNGSTKVADLHIGGTQNIYAHELGAKPGSVPSIYITNVNQPLPGAAIPIFMH